MSWVQNMLQTCLSLFYYPQLFWLVKRSTYYWYCYSSFLVSYKQINLIIWTAFCYLIAILDVQPSRIWETDSQTPSKNFFTIFESSLIPMTSAILLYNSLKVDYFLQRTARLSLPHELRHCSTVHETALEDNQCITTDQCHKLQRMEERRGLSYLSLYVSLTSHISCSTVSTVAELTGESTQAGDSWQLTGDSTQHTDRQDTGGQRKKPNWNFWYEDLWTEDRILQKYRKYSNFLLLCPRARSVRLYGTVSLEYYDSIRILNFVKRDRIVKNTGLFSVD